jgi:D-serine dehydratase
VLDEAALRSLDEEPADWRFKGFPALPGATIGSLARQGLNVKGGEFGHPIMVLKSEELDHNLRWMRDYCASHGALLAPHAKTTMSPQLVDRQLEHGAWAITVANVSQARVFLRFGAKRLIIANQLVREADLVWLSTMCRASPEVEFFVLADSLAGVAAMDAALEGVHDGLPPVQVLLEMGYEGGRAGVRTSGEAVAVAEAIAAADHLELAGLEGFEGVMPGVDREQQAPGIADYLDRVRGIVSELRMSGLLGSAIVSFGGSAYFDLVTESFSPEWCARNDARLVLRSGCYLTHDHGMYSRLAPADGLRPAIEVISSVSSVPGGGLAIAAFGKRDVPFDAGLPVVLRVERGAESLDPGDVTVTGLNDQHAYLADPHGVLAVGDVLTVGISHPCTAFDKWQLIPLVDADYAVVGAVRTFF